jgi:hypothetical protein
VHDVNNTNRIFGLDLANLRGKMTRTKPERVRVEIVQIPWDFVQLRKYVMLVADVMFVNGLPFLVTFSRGLSLVRIEYLPSTTAKLLVHTLQTVFRIYGTAGFVVQVGMMDMEFEKLRDMLPNVTLNTTAVREHVGEIERKIRVLKERGRGTIKTLPYETMPKQMIIELMHFCVMWMHSFPVKSVVSEKWSPRELVSMHKLDAKLHCKALFGSYCKVHVDMIITNTMEPRTKSAICLGPTGKRQGSYKFISLTTGNKIIRRNFTKMTLTESIIKQVKQMAAKDKLQIGLSFKNRRGEEYKFDNDEEYEMMIEPSEPAPFPDIAAEAPGVLTKQEEVFGVDEVVQEGPTQSNHEWAKLAAEKSGLDFSSMLPKKVGNKNNIVEILEDKEDEALDKYIKEEVLVKLEKDNDKDTAHTNDEDTMRTNTLEKIPDNNDSTNRRSGRQRIANQRYEQDYKLYVTAEEVEKEKDRDDGKGNRLSGISENKKDGNNNDNEGLVVVAHYIMVNYAKKDMQKRCRKKYKPKSGQYQLEAGIKHFGDQGEIVKHSSRKANQGLECS